MGHVLVTEVMVEDEPGLVGVQVEMKIVDTVEALQLVLAVDEQVEA